MHAHFRCWGTRQGHARHRGVGHAGTAGYHCLMLGCVPGKTETDDGRSSVGVSPCRGGAWAERRAKRALWHATNNALASKANASRLDPRFGEN